MRYLPTILLFISALAFTSCSDKSIEENEEILQLEIQEIDKEDYEVPDNGHHSIDKEDYEVPNNG